MKKINTIQILKTRQFFGICQYNVEVPNFFSLRVTKLYSDRSKAMIRKKKELNSQGNNHDFLMRYLIIFTNPSARAGYDTGSTFFLNSEFSFS